MLKLLDVEGDIAIGEFVSRYRKFVLYMRVNGRIIKCRMVETGRLPKLLVPGAKVACLLKSSEGRKTAGDVLGIMSNGKWILTNTMFHRPIAERLIESDLLGIGRFSRIIPECRYGSSRIDFCLSNSRKALLEVKGVSLFENGYGYYPDAPTERGRRHLRELMRAVKEGYEGYLLFLVLDDVRAVRPNCSVDPEFCTTFRKAVRAGVKPVAAVIGFNLKEIYFLKTVPVEPDY